MVRASGLAASRSRSAILPLGLAQDPISKQRPRGHRRIVYAPSLEVLAAAQKQIAKRARNPYCHHQPYQRTSLGTERRRSWLRTSRPRPARCWSADVEALPTPYWLRSKAARTGTSPRTAASRGTTTRLSALDYCTATKRLSVGRLLRDWTAMGRPRLVVLSACETRLYGLSGHP